MKFTSVLVIGLVLMVCNGCSVMMAMHGKEDANLGVLSIGQDRAIILANLGQPEKTVISGGTTVDVFKLQKGNEPSAGRALGHGALDLLTFGAWEVVGTPVEAMQGKTYTLTIEYDENQKVKKVITGDSQPGQSK